MVDLISVAVKELLDTDQEIGTAEIYHCLTTRGLRALADTVERVAFNKTYGPR